MTHFQYKLISICPSERAIEVKELFLCKQYSIVNFLGQCILSETFQIIPNHYAFIMRYLNNDMQLFSILIQFVIRHNIISTCLGLFWRKTKYTITNACKSIFQNPKKCAWGVAGSWRILKTNNGQNYNLNDRRIDCFQMKEKLYFVPAMLFEVIEHGPAGNNNACHQLQLIRKFKKKRWEY